MSFNEESPPC